jgi:hypothetical protein
VLEESERKSVLGVLNVSTALLRESAMSVVDALCTGGLAASSMLSGLSDLLATKPFSNRFSPDMSAGPVMGPSALRP